VARFLSSLLMLLCGLLLCPLLALAQTTRHPLDALRTEEYWTVYDVLQASGHVDEDTQYASVLLHEPAKETVLGWNQGRRLPAKQT